MPTLPPLASCSLHRFIDLLLFSTQFNLDGVRCLVHLYSESLTDLHYTIGPYLYKLTLFKILVDVHRYSTFPSFTALTSLSFCGYSDPSRISKLSALAHLIWKREDFYVC